MADKPIRNFFRYWMCALALVCGLAIAPPAFAAKDTLVIGISQFPRNFNPNIESMLAKSYVLAMARRQITIYDPNWKLICLLCTELPTYKNGRAKNEKTADGKDGIAVTYSLLPQAVWGDGTPITVKDVLFTWQAGRHKQSGFGNSELFERITSIDVIDDKTFTLHVNKRTCDFAGISGLELLPAHIEEANFAEPVEYRKRSAYETDTTNPGLWYGPYRIAEVVSGSHIVLERNPKWWGQKPAFKRIIVKAIENTAALTANLLSGDIDYIAGELGMTVDQALAFEKRAKDKFDFEYKSGLIYEHIDVNLDNPVLADIRMRRALLHAIDRNAINQQLFAGHQPVAHGQTNPLDTVYNPDTPKYAYDPKQAKALLDAAGWSVIKQGIRHKCKGRTAATGTDDHGGQQVPRTGPAGHPEPAETGRHRSAAAQRTGTGVLWRHRQPAQVPRHGDVCLGFRTAEHSADDPVLDPGADTGKQLVRTELSPDTATR